ncbi:MAG TPA: C/D box methylation guide ribonucleoprotein complex aNOP56 subunit [Candidatus Bathyarchaeia archaeon]
MKAYLIDSPAGLFLIEKTGKISERALFAHNPTDAAAQLKQVLNGELPKESSSFGQRLSQLELDLVTVDSEPLARLARSMVKSEVVQDENDSTISKLRNRLPSILVRLRIIESKDEYEQFVRDVSLALAKTAITEATTKRDLYAIQTVRSIEDLDKILNLLAGRVREWYGLHFPELDRLVEKHDSYIRLIHSLGSRESFSFDALAKLGIPQDKATQIAASAEKSSGAEMSGTDLEWLREVCGTVLELYGLREDAEKYTDKIMGEVAPNMTSVLGAVLSAKLISMAGGLENVAKMPSSTLQVLGAEKALFRTLKTGARPPKHGIIFQYAPIHQSPKWLRGKIARAVAGKLAIAARMDVYGGGDKGQALKDALDKKIEDLKGRYQSPPHKREHGKTWRPPAQDVRRDVLGGPRGQREIGHPQPGSRDDRLRGRYRKDRR